MQCCHIVYVGVSMNDVCLPVTGLHSWLLLQVCEVLSPPHPPTTGLHSHHILQNVNPRKKLLSAHNYVSLYTQQGMVVGAQSKTQNPKDLCISTNTINFSPVLHCQSFQFCSPGEKYGVIGLLGLDLGVGSYVWHCEYSCGCQSSHKMVVSKKQGPIFQDKPYEMKLSG